MLCKSDLSYHHDFSAGGIFIDSITKRTSSTPGASHHKSGLTSPRLLYTILDGHHDRSSARTRAGYPFLCAFCVLSCVVLASVAVLFVFSSYESAGHSPSFASLLRFIFRTLGGFNIGHLNKIEASRQSGLGGACHFHSGAPFRVLFFKLSSYGEWPLEAG